MSTVKRIWRDYNDALGTIAAFAALWGVAYLILCL